MSKARKYIPLIKPYIPRQAIAGLINVLNSGWLTQGKLAGKLEEKIARYTKTKFAFLLNSATSGLIACVKALGLTINDEIIGFISITPPNHKYSIDKYISREELSQYLTPDDRLYEIRLLSVVDEYRSSILALLLMFSA